MASVECKYLPIFDEVGSLSTSSCRTLLVTLSFMTFESFKILCGKYSFIIESFIFSMVPELDGSFSFESYSSSIVTVVHCSFHRGSNILSKVVCLDVTAFIECDISMQYSRPVYPTIIPSSLLQKCRLFIRPTLSLCWWVLHPNTLNYELLGAYRNVSSYGVLIFKTGIDILFYTSAANWNASPQNHLLTPVSLSIAQILSNNNRFLRSVRSYDQALYTEEVFSLILSLSNYLCKARNSASLSVCMPVALCLAFLSIHAV